MKSGIQVQSGRTKLNFESAGVRLVLALLVSASCMVGSASADPPRLERIQVETETRQVRRNSKPKKKGTHFIGEFNIGPVWGSSFPEDAFGFGMRTTFGYGGGFKGFAPRFYGIVAARYTRLTAHVEKATLLSDIERQMVDLSVGLRILMPVQRFRFLAEFTIGGNFLTSTATVNQRDVFETDDQRFTVYAGLGGQYRIHRHLSIGFLGELALPTSRQLVDFVSQVSRVRDDEGMLGWVSLSATIVGHF
ncbi:MAG: hypothetical protein ACI9OJ_002012 [Myxococcota bacterium]|jgi:hypothetical protein